MEKHTYLITKLFGYDITVNIPSVITTLITVLLTFIIVMFLTSRIKLRPDSKRQNAVELLAYFVSDNVIKGNVNWKKYGKGLWATALTIISLIAVANTIGVLIEVSYNGVVYVNSVTADPTFTFSLALLVIVFTHFAGIKYKGVKHYFGTYTSSGIGIAPIIPMLMELEKIDYQGKVSLFYSNRTLAKTTYHERLGNYNIKNYNYNPVFTGIQPRINIDLLKEKLDDIYDAHYYIIGTGEFIKTMKTLLEENNISKDHYLVDNFG